MKLSYLDICIEIKKKENLKLRSMTKEMPLIYIIVKVPFLDNNIPTKPAYGVYISQLVRIGRICGQYEDFKNRHHLLANRLLKQSYKYDQLCLYFKRFSSKYKDIFKVTLKQHIKDSIPLPLATMGRLNRLVTVR